MLFGAFMKPAAVIPARYGSTRLPGKLLLDLCGRPIIQRVYDQAKEAGIFSRIIVATDSEEILRTVEAFGGEAVMTSSKHQCGTERLAEAAAKISEEYIINIQGDEPFLHPSMLQGLWASFKNESVAVMGTLQHPFSKQEDPRNPHAVKVVTDENGYALYFSRSLIPYRPPAAAGEKNKVKAKRAWFKHVGVYIYHRDFLLHYPTLSKSFLEEAEGLEQLRVLAHGYRVRVYTTDFKTIGIDTEEDLYEARRRWEAQGGAFP